MCKLILKNNLNDSSTHEYYLIIKNEEVGFIQVRQKPTKSLEMPSGFENHIYYEIFPKYRKLGYGCKILELGLIESKKIGLSCVRLTSKKDNISSQKIIEQNGGILIKTGISGTGDKILLYEINIKR